MKDRKLATRYARALLSSLHDETTSETADQFLVALGEAFEKSGDFRDLMLDPVVPRDLRKKALRQLASESGAPTQIQNFLDAVVDHNRESSLPSIAAVFHEEREHAAGIVSAEMTTAVPLGDDLRQRAMEAIQKMTGRRVRLTTNVDEDLLGGAVTKVGSKIYDGSLRAQLDELRRRMIQE